MPPTNRHLALVSTVFLLLPIIATCITPSPVSYAAGKLVNTTIWIFGGIYTDGYTSIEYKTLLSLDVSQPFSSSSPPWTDHSSDGANQAFVYARDGSTME